MPVETYAELSVRAAKEASPGRAHPQDHASAIGVAAVLTYPALPRQRHAISGITWSFDANPTNGHLRIDIGGRLTFYISIMQGGVGLTRVKRRSRTNEALIITLNNTAAGVRGDVNVDQYWTGR